jgi:hypothetical protein
MLKKLLSQSSYWIINKDLAIKLGFEPTLLLTHLIDCADMLDQPFYQQRDRILKSLGWSEKTYRNSVKKLKDTNLIQTEVRGIPPKNYWTINESQLDAFIKSNSSDISVDLTLPKERRFDATKIRNKKNNNNSIELISSEGGVTLEELPTTSSDAITHDEGGWEKLIRLYPKDKLNDEISAITKWNMLTQQDKQKVFRHLKVYIKNTEHQYIKQIGNYFKEEPWIKMKPQRKKNEGLEIIDATKKSQQSLENEDFLRKLSIKTN